MTDHDSSSCRGYADMPMPIPVVARRSAACRVHDTARSSVQSILPQTSLLNDQPHIILPSADLLSSSGSSLLTIIINHLLSSTIIIISSASRRPSVLVLAQRCTSSYHLLSSTIIIISSASCRPSVLVLAQRRTSSFALGQAFSPQRRRTSSFPRPIILGHNPSRNLNDIILHRG